MNKIEFISNPYLFCNMDSFCNANYSTVKPSEMKYVKCDTIQKIALMEERLDKVEKIEEKVNQDIKQALEQFKHIQLSNNKMVLEQKKDVLEYGIEVYNIKLKQDLLVNIALQCIVLWIIIQCFCAFQLSDKVLIWF